MSNWSHHIAINVAHPVLTNGGSQHLWFLYQNWHGNVPVIHTNYFFLLCFVLIHAFWMDDYI